VIQSRFVQAAVKLRLIFVYRSRLSGHLYAASELVPWPAQNAAGIFGQGK
jgi:hypothetical protein